MKTLGCVLSVLAGLTVMAHLQALQPSPFAGTWHGQANGLPAVTLTVQDSGNRLSGTIVFYLQKRDSVGQPWRTEGGAIEPLIDPRADGERLSFEVRHAKEHGSSEYGPNVAMTVVITGPNEARLGEVLLKREP